MHGLGCVPELSHLASALVQMGSSSRTRGATGGVGGECAETAKVRGHHLLTVGPVRHATVVLVHLLIDGDGLAVGQGGAAVAHQGHFLRKRIEPGLRGLVEHVVAGIGVNVGFAPQIPDMRYAGAMLGGTVEDAACRLARALAHRLAQWRQGGFEDVRVAWLAKAGPLGAEVDVRLGTELVKGRFAGLDRDGGLLLDTPTGPRRIVSGELLGRPA